MKTIDTRGQTCPAPLIATRKAYKESEAGESFKVITGSRNALNNISKFLEDNHIEYSVTEKDMTWIILITKSI